MIVFKLSLSSHSGRAKTLIDLMEVVRFQPAFRLFTRSIFSLAVPH